MKKTPLCLVVTSEITNISCTVDAVTVLDACMAGPCQNNATCITGSQSGNYTCVCQAGTSGTRCEHSQSTLLLFSEH